MNRFNYTFDKAAKEKIKYKLLKSSDIKLELKSHFIVAYFKPLETHTDTDGFNHYRHHHFRCSGP